MENKVINIKSELNKLDLENYRDLRNTYEALKLNEKQKTKIAQMIIEKKEVQLEKYLNRLLENEFNDDRDELKYLLDKEKVAGLDKEDRYRLQQLKSTVDSYNDYEEDDEVNNETYTLHICYNEAAANRMPGENSFEEIKIKAKNDLDALLKVGCLVYNECDEESIQDPEYLEEFIEDELDGDQDIKSIKDYLDYQDPSAGWPIVYGVSKNGNLIFDFDFKYWERLKQGEGDYDDEDLDESLQEDYNYNISLKDYLNQGSKKYTLYITDGESAASRGGESNGFEQINIKANSDKEAKVKAMVWIISHSYNVSTDSLKDILDTWNYYEYVDESEYIDLNNLDFAETFLDDQDPGMGGQFVYGIKNSKNDLIFDFDFDGWEEEREDIENDYYDESLNEDKNRCVICGGPLGKYGNNAEPVAHGKCCDKCNKEKVIPARLKSASLKEDYDDYDKELLNIIHTLNKKGIVTTKNKEIADQYAANKNEYKKYKVDKKEDTYTITVLESLKNKRRKINGTKYYK